MKPRFVILLWILTVIAVVPAFGRGTLTEEFHQSYALGPHARISLNNINGDVQIVASDTNEVKVDAIKTADTQRELQEAKIEVDTTGDSISIETRYPRHNNNNAASVDYKLTVPRDSQLDTVNLVNGKLNIEGVRGDVEASCVNGGLTASGLAGEAKLSTVNGKLHVTFDRVENAKSISLSSVNGSIDLALPNNADADFQASTMSGHISSDFGFSEEKHSVGHEMSGTLGKGSTHIKLSNVNGAINIRQI